MAHDASGAPAPAEHPATTGDLIRVLTSELSVLVRQEMQLARAELGRKARDTGTGAGALGAAAVLALLSVAAVTAAGAAALALALPAWAAALIASAVCAGGSGVLAAFGVRRLRRSTPPVPVRTFETVKEDVEWARTQMRSAGR